MRELGCDPEQILREWQAFATRLDELGLVFEIDPRRTTSQGSRVTPPAPETELDRSPDMAAAPPRMNEHAPSETQSSTTAHRLL